MTYMTFMKTYSTMTGRHYDHQREVMGSVTRELSQRAKCAAGETGWTVYPGLPGDHLKLVVSIESSPRALLMEFSAARFLHDGNTSCDMQLHQNNRGPCDLLF